MPLDLSGLKADLKTLFASPPADTSDCAQAWADAVGAYAAGIVPVSTTVTSAADTLSTALAAAFATPAAAPGMETAFAAFAATVGGGMAGYVPTPPAAPVGLALQFAGPKPSTHKAAADQIGTLIDTWMKTGLGTLAVPPNTVVTWT